VFFQEYGYHVASASSQVAGKEWEGRFGHMEGITYNGGYTTTPGSKQSHLDREVSTVLLFSLFSFPIFFFFFLPSFADDI